MGFLLALSTNVAAVATLYASWRQSHRWTPLMTLTGWALVSLSAVLWSRFAGAEFGLAYAAIALAFTTWGCVAALGREGRRLGDRRGQPRVAREVPGRTAIWRTLARALVALPLAGTTSLLASVLLVAGLPWTTANRYVTAIMMAPLIWGLLAVWAGMTATLSRVALLLACVSAACAALLFVR